MGSALCACRRPEHQQARNQSDATRAGQQATATSQGTKAGEQAAAAPYMNALSDDPSDAGTAKNIAIIEQLTGQPYDASKGPPIAGPLTLKSNQDWQVANAGRTKGAEAAGTAANTPINPAEPKIFPPPGGFAPTAPATPAVAAPPAAPATSPPDAAAPAAAPPVAAPPDRHAINRSRGRDARSEPPRLVLAGRNVEGRR